MIRYEKIRQWIMVMCSKYIYEALTLTIIRSNRQLIGHISFINEIYIQSSRK